MSVKQIEWKVAWGDTAWEPCGCHGPPLLPSFLLPPSPEGAGAKLDAVVEVGVVTVLGCRQEKGAGQSAGVQAAPDLWEGTTQHVCLQLRV